MKIVVLGATGMLGSMALDFLGKEEAFNVTGTARDDCSIKDMRTKIADVEWCCLDAQNCRIEDLQKILGGASWAVNAIGIIKPHIHDENPFEVERATRVNSLFPYLLAKAVEGSECRVAQIATDCVYSGVKGNYVESDPHDPLDVYGKTKSLGEVFSPNFFNLRCSIIGPERRGHLSLLDWFTGQKPNAILNGYVNHSWNGVTTLHFAKLLSGIIRANLTLPHLQHIVPDDRVSKHELLHVFARFFKRDDIEIRPMKATNEVDRTLGTMNGSLNLRLWEAAGYSSPPTVSDMFQELAAYPYPFR